MMHHDLMFFDEKQIFLFDVMFPPNFLKTISTLSA